VKVDVLTRPFQPEQIKQRAGHHGKQLAYVDVAAVITRLNEAFEHQWSFEVVSHDIQHDEVIVLGKLTADGISKTHFGGSRITLDGEGRAVSLADDLKAAGSDALKKTASLFGVGLEMYGGAPERRVTSTENGGRPESPKATIDERITSRQLAAIQSACRRQSIGRDELAKQIAGRTGKSAPQFLSKAEASELLTELDQRNGTHA
jgi:hypothetical protein